MIDVLVVGGHGRMGSLVARTVEAQPDMRLVALVDPAYGSDADPTSTAAVASFTELALALQETAPTVAVEFSLPASVYANTLSLLAAGVDTVVGATGLTDEQLAQLFTAARESHAHLFVAPNFALGAVLLMEFSRQAARVFARAEIIELHHESKVDAPSGTALRTAALMNDEPASRLVAASQQRGATEAVTADGAEQPVSRGLEQGAVHVHSVRLPGLVAHQEVLFGGTGELLTLRHDSFALESFMTGVMLAVRTVGQLEEPTVGLEKILAE
ncbi:MAG: 4-hydroxy-tetrahydrodipicolinate reductase [Thermoleophilia bacterium]